jgi:uncharacterized membrane protein YciS (DUF1049 family)
MLILASEKVVDIIAWSVLALYTLVLNQQLTAPIAFSSWYALSSLLTTLYSLLSALCSLISALCFLLSTLYSLSDTRTHTRTQGCYRPLARQDHVLPSAHDRIQDRCCCGMFSALFFLSVLISVFSLCSHFSSYLSSLCKLAFARLVSSLLSSEPHIRLSGLRPCCNLPLGGAHRHLPKPSRRSRQSQVCFCTVVTCICKFLGAVCTQVQPHATLCVCTRSQHCSCIGLALYLHCFEPFRGRG